MLTWSLQNVPSSAGTCHGCGAAGTLHAHVKTAHQADAGTDCIFDRCSNCGSLSLRGQMIAFEHLYDTDEALFVRSYVESSGGLWEMLWPVALLADARDRSFLEVGCGFGFTVDWWHRCMNADAIGCDPAVYSAVGRKLLGSHIHNALLADVPEARARQFDLIYASEVIEHVDNPVAFVHELAARLTPRGVLVLTTPAAEFVAPENSDHTVTAALAPGFHGVLFSEKQLGALMRQSGFACVETWRYNERLVCWCSVEPVRFLGGADAALPVYFGYLADIVKRLQVPQSAGKDIDSQRISLRAGAAYRLYKELVLRGQVAEARKWRHAAHRDLLLEHRTESSTEAAVDAFLDSADGSFESFLAGARLHLPQLCFVEGQVAEREGDVASAARWYRRCEAATRWIVAGSRLGNIEASAFVWSAIAGLVRTFAAGKQLQELQGAAMAIAFAVIRRDSPYASVPDPVTAANGLLQAFAAMQESGGNHFSGLIEAMQQQNVPPHPLLSAAIALARARHAQDILADQALAGRIADDARKALDLQAETPAGRWLGADVTASLRQALTRYVPTPASFSSLFAR